MSHCFRAITIGPLCRRRAEIKSSRFDSLKAQRRMKHDIFHPLLTADSQDDSVPNLINNIRE
jgi:hypothetical protein